MEKEFPTKDDYQFSELGGYIRHQKSSLSAFEVNCLIAGKIMSLCKAREIYHSAEKTKQEETCAMRCRQKCLIS